MGAARINILVQHFKQYISHFTPDNIFRAGTVRASRVINLLSQALFPNLKAENDINCTLFQIVNVRLSVIYFGIHESSNAFTSMFGYSKMYRKNFKKLMKYKM
jgi:hypothetical protein